MGVTTDKLDVTTISKSNGAEGDGFDADILGLDPDAELMLFELDVL